MPPTLPRRCAWMGAAFGLAWIALGLERTLIFALCLLAGYTLGLALEREAVPGEPLSSALARAASRLRARAESLTTSLTQRGERYGTQRRIR